MFDVKHVTLCLLITYHWHGCTASPNVSGPPTTDGIVGEVNGSPTDALLNIPVVKRSSNQAGSANELRPVLVERARAIVGVVPTHSKLPHEYANRNEEKYTSVILEPMGKLGVAQPPLDAETMNHDQAKRHKNVVNEDEEEEEEEEVRRKENDVGRIKSSIPTKDAAMGIELGLIGKGNSSPLDSRFQRLFDYERASGSRIRHKRNQEGLSGVTEKKKEYKKATEVDELNNKEAVVSSSESDALDSEALRISDQDGKQMKTENGNGSLHLGSQRIEEVIGKDDSKQIQNKRKEDRNGSRLHNRLTSFLKLRERPHLERNKSNIVSSLTSNGDVNKVLDSKRPHQQSRNTKPEIIAQHLRRNIKRQILTLGDLMYDRTARFNGGEKELAEAKKNVRGDDRSRRQLGEPQLRFIPSNNHRFHTVANRVYFGKNAQQNFPSQVLAVNNNDASSFYPTSETNPRAIEKFPRFDAAQIESLKGVFDKYDIGRDGKRNDLPNVRMILPKQIFIAPPRLVYDTRILPAPFSFPPYFQAANENVNPMNNNDDEDREKIAQPGLMISGVFDKGEMGDREVIPVRENLEPSLTDPQNFVTPLPPYRVDGGNGQVSIQVNQASKDFAELDEIYRVRSEDIGNGAKEKEKTQRDGKDENSRLNHESPIDVGTAHHPGFGGSSYDNSVGTFGSVDESGSGNVDHSAVIEGNTDEYVNHEPSNRGSYTPVIRTRTQSAAKSNDETYDKGGYKWRGKYDNDNERYAANYSFGYQVSDYETQNNFGHQETRKDGITKGKYHVKLPDGRIQEVDYHVDDKGYHARVSYRLDRA